MRVQLIVTGVTELLGLADSLRRIFPAHEFSAEPARKDPNGRLTPFDGFTTAPLTPELEAVRQLEWTALLAAKAYNRHVRDLICDLAEVLGQPEIDLSGGRNQWTVDESRRVLRNV